MAVTTRRTPSTAPARRQGSTRVPAVVGALGVLAANVVIDSYSHCLDPLDPAGGDRFRTLPLPTSRKKPLTGRVLGVML